MKRDLEMMIGILKYIEENCSEHSRIKIKHENHDYKEVQYNVGLMLQAGLINASDMTTFEGTSYIVRGLTWEGHDFLDAARNEVVVDKVKEFAKSKGLEFASLPIDMAKELLSNALRGMFGL